MDRWEDLLGESAGSACCSQLCGEYSITVMVVTVADLLMLWCLQVVCGGGERMTISDDEDIYSDQQKLPRRVANKVQVSFAV